MLQRALKIVSLVQGKNETKSSSEPFCGRKSFEEFHSNLVVPYPTQNVMSLQEIMNNRYTNKKEETTTFNLDTFMKQVNDLLFQSYSSGCFSTNQPISKTKNARKFKQ